MNISINRYVFLLILLFVVRIGNGIFPQTKHETRAVWVATNYRMDWPPATFDEEEQKDSLKKIFLNIRSMNFNTIYFQVRSNSTLLYHSDIEAFSPYFKGRVNALPNYDPLELAIKTSHNLGLEIHAWFNTFRCLSGEDSIFLNFPEHLVNLHPNWIVKYSEEGKVSYWLDPGLPDVRNYLLELLKELVENYNIDGINLDYLRYPGKNFNDSFSYSVYGKEEKKDEWRRKNILKFLKKTYTELKKINPLIKIGVSPIGVYKNKGNTKYLSAYKDVFQDAFAFLQNKIVDYLSPQIYWAYNDSPSFHSIAADWIKYSNGRNIILGLGIYKKKVASEIPLLIKTVETLGADGIAFFRYGNISESNFNGFANFAYPAKTNWIKIPGVAPPSNFNAEIINEMPMKIKLKWKVKTVNKFQSKPSYFSIFLVKGENENLVSMLPASKNSVTLTINNPTKLNYFFRIKTVDKLWNESKKSLTLRVKNNFLTKEINFNLTGNSPALFSSKDNLVIRLISNYKDNAVVTFYNNDKGKNRYRFWLESGENFLVVPNKDNTKVIELKLKKQGNTYKLHLNRVLKTRVP